MHMFLLIGLRNLLRRKWRTLATCTMLFIGGVLLVFMTGLAEGTYGTMINVGTKVFNGDFQVLHSDYNEKPGLFKSVSDYRALGERLRRDPRVTGISYRVEAPGLLSSGNATMGGLLVGMDPESEICSYLDTLSEGTWWRGEGLSDELPVVLGKGIARRLDIGLGDELTFVGQGADGSIAAELFVVVGLMDSGMDEMDRNLGFIPLQAAQELLVMEGRVHRVVGMMAQRNRLPQLTRDYPLASPLQLLGWKTLLPSLATTIQKDRQGAYLFVTIIILVVLISVGNTMLMSVMERTHELGVIQALGTSPMMMVAIILGEIFILSLMGLLPGVLTGVGLNAWFADAGIPTGMDEFSYGGVPMNRMYTANTIGGTLIAPLLVLLGALLAGLLPAVKAATMSPIEAMRD